MTKSSGGFSKLTYRRDIAKGSFTRKRRAETHYPFHPRQPFQSAFRNRHIAATPVVARRLLVFHLLVAHLVKAFRGAVAVIGIALFD